ncbi:MAG: manganese efflux pump [Candidatus Aminicenantes bacterium]|nr:manganese efflux pump [Candidatus Aminicenantes bacterium]
MNFLVVLGLALALAMDAFAVSLGVGLNLVRASAIQTLRLAFSFGLFQFFMPVIGWSAGTTVIRLIERFDHWVAFALLLGVGSKMIFESFRGRRDIRANKSDPTKGLSLFVLSIATSLDSLAVGLSLAALRVAVVYPAAIIGIVAFVMTVAGMKLGPLAGRVIGKRAELAGGLILILIGIKILADHL